MPVPSPQSSDGTTSQSTKPASGQVAGYPASGRGGERIAARVSRFKEREMNDHNQQAVAHYRNNFLREVEERVEDGEWVRMCMQCGVGAGSCPLGNAWQHTPQKLFMMIRAGKREEVLTSDSMWRCTSCYNCIVPCPRKLPITHIMHGLANYAHRLNLVPTGPPTPGGAR